MTERCNNCGASVAVPDVLPAEDLRCPDCGARLYVRLRRLNRRAARERGPLEVAAAYRRASGESICAECSKPYRKHPRGGPLGMDDEQFLRRLCNGDLVKL